MAYNLNSFKVAGVIYKIAETEYTKKSSYPKRKFYLEVPTAAYGSQKTDIMEFTVIGDEAGSLDWYREGDWVEVLFRINGRWWKPPDKEEKIFFQSLMPIDIHKGENPFNKNPEEMSQDPDDHSPDIFSQLASNVKDYANMPKKSSLFDKEEDDIASDLPF